MDQDARFDPESHRGCTPGCVWKDRLSDTTITRLDRYTIEVNGARVRATEDQERRIRSMADALDRFLRVMGVKP